MIGLDLTNSHEDIFFLVVLGSEAVWRNDELLLLGARIVPLVVLLLHFCLGFLLCLLGLLVVGDFLETEEVLTGLFVKLALDPLDNELDLGDLNELQSVHTTVRDFQGLVD